MTPEKNSSIRKEVKKAKSKVAKNFFQVGLATSMILVAPACVPTEATSIIPTGETNPLPGDFTKTAESPTEATYEVTSTPGIESTINPPTEVATEMPTATATEMPTPTEIPLIQGDIFYDPQSKEDFKNVALAPSPIDEPEKFALWQDEYLKQVNEKLETYEGAGVETSTMGIDYQTAVICVDSKEWPVIASYKFSWNGQEMLTKTFVFRYNSDGYIPISITYTTSDSLIYDTNWQYRTPSELLSLSMFYEWNDRLKSTASDKFADSFLPETNEGLESFRNLFGGVGNEEDIWNAIRTPLIMSRFN